MDALLKRGSDNRQMIVMTKNKNFNQNDIFKIRHNIHKRLQYSHNVMLEEFLTSCELIRKVDIFESLITIYLRRQQIILCNVWAAKGIDCEYDIEELGRQVDAEMEVER